MSLKKGKRSVSKRKKLFIVGKPMEKYESILLFNYAETLSQIMSPMDKLATNIEHLAKQGSITREDASSLQVEIYKKLNPIKSKYSEIVEILDKRMLDDTGLTFSVNEVQPFLEKIVLKHPTVSAFYGLEPQKEISKEEE